MLAPVCYNMHDPDTRYQDNSEHVSVQGAAAVFTDQLYSMHLNTHSQQRYSSLLRLHLICSLIDLTDTESVAM